MNLSRLLPAALLAALALAAATAASAQTVINAVPFTISASGKYVLGANLVTATNAQTAITISAPNVILDLNGFFVSGPQVAAGSTTPVISVGNVSNVTIRNGTVANNGYGLQFGGGATNSINHLVEDLNLTRCIVASIFFVNASSGSIVRRNVLSQNGGSTLPGAPSIGLSLQGGVRAERNTITDILAPTGGGGGFQAGISCTAGNFLIRNTVTNAPVGINGGKYQNNLFINCATPFTGGTNAGGNF